MKVLFLLLFLPESADPIPANHCTVGERQGLASEFHPSSQWPAAAGTENRAFEEHLCVRQAGTVLIIQLFILTTTEPQNLPAVNKL